MRLQVILTAACLYACLTFAQAGTPSAGSAEAAGSGIDTQKATQAAPFPLQLEMRVPFEPTAFPSGPHIYLMYELHLTNYLPMPLSLARIDVLDADSEDAQSIASFGAEQLESMLQPLGARKLADPKEKLIIGAGQSAIVYMCITFDHKARIPDKLVHRVSTADAALEGAVIGTHHTELHVLGPPVEGADWLADDGPSNGEDNHHRRGVVIVDGQAVDSRRYAIDWKQVVNGTSFSADPRDVHSYYSYGKSVLAVADGRVLVARDGLPDNIPGHGEAFHPAVPITLGTVAGNTITLDLGDGQFAYYLHLQPGSLRVKTGDKVRRGQVLGSIGASGDAREPHLHFEVTTSSKLVAGEGLPYLIDRYRCKSTTDGTIELRIRELPLDKSIILFGTDHSRGN
jgi:Peptidase family M23